MDGTIVTVDRGGFMTVTSEPTSQAIVVPPGLRGVVVSDTTTGDVRGDEGFYHYRQYSAVDLARARSFEDVWFLFFEGHLPDAAERDRFLARIAGLRRLPEELDTVLPTLATTAGGLTGLRAALSILGAARDLGPTWGASPEQRTRDAMLVCAATPTILAALYRLRLGLDPVEPRDDLHGAANWLHLLTGDEPDPRHVAAVEHYLVATVDHGFNASTFTARVVASAGSDVASAVTAAIGAFVGPLHGGAPDRALASLDEIGTVDRIDPYVRDRLRSGDRIMGFGHAVYRTEDPRARMLRDIAEGLRDQGLDGTGLVDLAVAVEKRVVEILAELKPDRELNANVEFYAGVVMALCGIPREMFTPTFAVSRVVGWSAHILEQSQGSTIIRPAARYVGPPPPQPVPAG